MTRSAPRARSACAPFLPTTAERIAQAFGTPLPNPYSAEAITDWSTVAATSRIQRGAVLFPKIEPEPTVR